MKSNKKIPALEFIRKPISIAILLLHMITVALLAIFLRAEMTGFYILYVMSRYTFFVAAFFAVITFISCSACKRYSTEETISAYKHSGYYQNYTVRIMTIISVVYQAILIVFLLIASFENDGTDYFLSWFFKSFLCNIFFPLMICILLAYLLSRLHNSVAASAFLVLFLVGISPLYSMLNWQTQPSFPIDKIVSGIFHPFRILYENGDYTANALTGLQTDSGRIQILAFWIFLLLAAFAFLRFSSNRKNKPNLSTQTESVVGRNPSSRSHSHTGTIRAFTVTGLLAAGICCLILSFLPSGSFRISENWDGTWADFNYYYDQENGVSSSESTFRFTEYTLDISLGRTMQVNAGLQLEADSPDTQFVFTLYHGYEIQSVSCEDTSVTWQVDGDYVTITTDQSVQKMKLYITYTGSHSIFFAYDEGCLLPGWFPWYPMAGEKQVFVNYATVPSGYNTFNRIATAKISVSVNNKFVMVSNLRESSDGCYTGTSDSITLIGGEILLSEDSQVKNYLPLNLTISGEDNNRQLSDEWQTICDELEDYGLDLPTSRDCTIIIASKELCRFYSIDSAAIFEDYILTCTDTLTIENVSQQMILGQNSDSIMANIVCSLGGLYDTPEETLSYWMMYLSMDDDWGNDIAPLIYQALTLADENGEGADLVREIAQFLCSEDAADSEREFLEEVCARYDNN